MPELKVCNACGDLHPGTGSRCLRCHVPRRRAPAREAMGYKVYRSKAWQVARTEALERDGYLCVRCRAAEDLVVHHVIEIAPGMDPYEVGNLQTLCRSCHAREHQHRRTHARSQF